ncbi:MAG: GNAT family N-acetyltransferase [Desulfobacterales bacterium]|jgi:spermidine synthase
MTANTDAIADSALEMRLQYRFITAADDPATRQIIALYQTAGWWSHTSDDPDLVQRLIRGSHCFLIARLNRQIIGMGRAISDGASDAYIQDVTVQGDFRRQGIGRGLIERLTRRLEADGIHWIGLIAENNSQWIYTPLGFQPMPHAHPMVKIIP